MRPNRRHSTRRSEILKPAVRSGPDDCPQMGLCSHPPFAPLSVGFTDVTLHTLRHSIASTAADLGYSEPMIAAMIGHAAGSVTGRYIYQLDVVLIVSADKVAATIYR